MHIKSLVLSANIGTLFEETNLIAGWVEEVEKIVLRYTPNFIAFSFQELGGKDSINLHHIQFFCDQLDSIFKKEREKNSNSAHEFTNAYYSSGLIYEPDIKSPQFTAMGNLFMIHKKLLDQNFVQVWNRVQQTFQPIQNHNSNQSQIFNANECNFIFHQRFPNRKSRKGWIHSKWKLGNQIIDLMNIHLFHDDINTLAIQDTPSVYARDRLDALTLAARECGLSNDVPAILFGDFNVRLDKDFVEWLKSDFLKEHTNNNSESNNLEEFFSIKDKSFSLKFCHQLVEPQTIHEMRKFDREVSRFNQAQELQLHELPITFGFTYCLENHGEVMDKPVNFVKRIPAWCDRVLFTEPTKNLLSTDSAYSSIHGIKSTGDHTPVYLYFQFET